MSPSAPPAPPSLPARIAGVAIALLALAFLAWGLWQARQPQVTALQGQIDAQEINVSSKVPGRVGKLEVRLGQTVGAGDLLFQIDSPEVQAKLTQARAAQAAAEAVSGKAQRGARPEEIEMARLNLERARTAESLARVTYERVQAMLDEGVLARQKRDEAEAQWRAAQQQRAAADAQYRLVRSGARPEDQAAAAAQARQVTGALAEVEAADAETHVRAPAAGEVSRIQIQAGELAPQGFPVITLVNLADIWAVLPVREDRLAAFQPGSRHRVRVPALDVEAEFTVSSVAVMPDFATWRAARPGGTDLRTFEVRLRPVIPVKGLRPGMSVVFVS